MKKILYCSVLFASLFYACSTDNNNNNGDGDGDTFLPPTVGSYWEYNVSGDSEQTSGRDSIYVAGDTLINGNTYRKMKARSPIYGFYTNSLHQNGIRTLNGKLLLGGVNVIGYIEQLPLEIPVDDFVIFDADASTGSQVDIVEGTFTQTLEGYPLTVTYELKSRAGAVLPSYTAPDGTSYQDVRQMTYTLTATVTTVITLGEITVPVPVIDQQDIIVSNAWFAAGIGMVTTDTDVTYQLNEAAAGFVPFPASGSVNVLEVLDAYQIAD